ncbi:MAG: hypothetical protein KA810_08185 [Pyrinomonadaceae bacterium]|nr:hypothetical protein [Pyrinomonadaceae bacterium]
MSYLCLCGHVIKDNIYPCPERGDLKWQTESENISQESFEALKEFFNAVENDAKNGWLLKFFNHSLYLKADMATIVIDIMSRYDGKEGRSVYRCPECERMYVQTKYRSDEYECFEKRTDYSRNAEGLAD